MEAISHAGATVGLLAEDGVVLAAELKVTSKLLDPGHSSEKLYRIDEHIVCSAAGITADANSLIEYARETAQRYKYLYQENIPVEQLMQDVCDLMQGYTQYGGLRPFGVSFLFAGWDEHFGFQLYKCEPSGNYSAWRAMAVGKNKSNAQTLLKQEYEADISTVAATKLAVRVLSKTMDVVSLTHEKVELATLQRINGEVRFHILGAAEVTKVVDEVQADEAARPKTE